MWSIVAVETNLAWPTKDTYILYGRHNFLLRPETDEWPAAVCLEHDPTVSDTSRTEALCLLREFLSVLCWTEGRYVRELTHGGGGRLIRLGKPGRVQIINPNFRADHLPEVQHQKGRLALALYREALSVNSIPYQFLGYFKIINICYQSGSKQKRWIRSALLKITNSEALDRLSVLNDEQGDVAD